jgi:hypothetical protein
VSGGLFNTGGDVKSGTDKETKDQGSSNLENVLGTLGVNILDMLYPGGLTTGNNPAGWYTPRGLFGPIITGEAMGGPKISGDRSLLDWRYERDRHAQETGDGNYWNPNDPLDIRGIRGSNIIHQLPLNDPNRTDIRRLLDIGYRNWGNLLPMGGGTRPATFDQQAFEELGLSGYRGSLGF